jgi:RNA polymerase sigma-70 factor (ECF subfamily)
MEEAVPFAPAFPDDDSEAWLTALRTPGPARDAATTRLYELLLRAARFEVHRRRTTLPHLRGDDLDDLAIQSADDALMAIMAKLDTFRGESRFTTWAYKFALLEAAVKLRRRAWQGREIPLEPETWNLFEADRLTPEGRAEEGELLLEVQAAIKDELSAHQREVLVALAINGVPIDVLAERLTSTRGALYKTLHDARRKLRAALADAGYETHDHDHLGGGT